MQAAEFVDIILRAGARFQVYWVYCILCMWRGCNQQLQSGPSDFASGRAENGSTGMAWSASPSSDCHQINYINWSENPWKIHGNAMEMPLKCAHMPYRPYRPYRIQVEALQKCWAERPSLPLPSLAASRVSQLQKGWEHRSLSESIEVFGVSWTFRYSKISKQVKQRNSGLTSGPSMAITSSTAWISKSLEPLKDPWRISSCCRAVWLKCKSKTMQ